MRKVILSGCIVVLALIGYIFISNKTDDKNSSQSETEQNMVETVNVASPSSDIIYSNEYGTENTLSDEINIRSSDEDDVSAAIIPTGDGSVSEVNNEQIAETQPAKKAELELSILYQYPEIPAGCESVSLTMLLNYYGFNLDKYYIIDNYLIYSDNYVTGYYGNPYASTGGGCYAPGITDTANSFLSANESAYTAVNISGTAFYDLFDYIDAGTPVLIWTTIGLGGCSKDSDEVYYDGTVYSWDFMEHCVVLAGYDRTNGTVTLYDPIDGIVTRDTEQFKQSYEGMYQMAVVLQ